MAKCFPKSTQDYIWNLYTIGKTLGEREIVFDDFNRGPRSVWRKRKENVNSNRHRPTPISPMTEPNKKALKLYRPLNPGGI